MYGVIEADLIEESLDIDVILDILDKSGK